MATSTPSKRNAAVFADTITTTGNVVVGGNLTVSGTTTTINTETINLADNIIVLNSNASGAATENAGIEIERGTDANVSLLWDETNNRWTVGSSNFVAGTFIGALSGNASTASSAAKWTTARTHTVSLSGDVTGSASQSVDGTGNRTWSVSTSVANSVFHSRGNSPADLNDADMGVWRINQSEANRPSSGVNYGTLISFDNSSDTGFQIAASYSSNKELWFRGANASVYGGSGSFQAWERIFHTAYHPNADKWTTARTLSLTGDVTGSVSWDGSANASMTTTVANDSHSHSNYLPNSGTVPHSGLVYFTGTGATSGIRFNSATVANDAFGIRVNGTSNAGELEFYSTDDDTEPFVFRHYTTGQDGTGSSVEWARINNDYLSHSSDVRAPIFYDSNDTAYYVDPASTTQSARFRQFVQIGDSSSYNGNTGSWGARLNVTDNIHAKIEVGQDADGMLSHWYAHTGHSSIKFGTSSSHDVEIQRAGTTQLGVYSGYALAHNQMRSPIFYDSADTSYYWNPNDTAAHRFNTASGYVHIGPMNTSHCHISTDRSNFYFNTEIRVNSGLIGSYDEDLYLRRASNAAHQIQIAAGTTTISQNTVVQGTLTADNVQYPDDFGKLYTFTPSLTLTTSWQDTGIQAGSLASGSYIVQVSMNDHSVGGQYSETYTGYMTWYNGDTNDTAWDEIVLHKAGHADLDKAIYLRTLRTLTADTRNLVLQIASNTARTAAATYTFKFRRMI